MANPVRGITHKGIIGQGAFGVVHLVENDAGEQFAVKIMEWAGVSQSDKEVAENELGVLKELQHENVIVYVDSFLQKGLLYIFTEYCAGGDLSGFLDEIGRPVPQDLLLVWLRQMACGLEYMHTLNPSIMHRDLKPSNIYLTGDGDIRLGDMGIARVLDHPGMMAMTFCGTPPYMSPEALFEKPYSEKTDIWALGCCVVEMATLERAYEGSTLFTLLEVVRKERKPLPRPEYGGSLDNLVSQMLAQNPDERISSTELLNQELLLEVEDKADKPMDLLKRHSLVQGLAFHRRASPVSTMREVRRTTIRDLTPSLSNMQQILGNSDTMRSYHIKVERRMRGRASEKTLTDRNLATVLHVTQTRTTKTVKKRISFGSSGTSSTSSSSSSDPPTMKFHPPKPADDKPPANLMRSIVETFTSSLRSGEATLRGVQLTDTRTSSLGSDLSRSTLTAVLQTVLARAVGIESLESAVTLIESSRSRVDLMRDLQGLLGTEQFRTLGSAIIFLVLMQSYTMKSST